MRPGTIAIIISLSVMIIATILMAWILLKSKEEGIQTTTSFSKKNKNKKKANNISVSLAQNFFPVVSFRDNMIELPNHHFRAILEITSVNYFLQNPAQKVQIEKAFQRFLMSLQNTPITFFRLTSTVDLQKYFEFMKSQTQDASQQFPKLTQYGEEYLANLRKINIDFSNIDDHKLIRNKKNYIVLNYTPSNTKMEEQDIRKEAAIQLKQQCDALNANLSSTGIIVNVLLTDGLVKLFTSIFHRDEEDFSSHIVQLNDSNQMVSDYTKLIVNGQNLLANRSISEQIYDILDNARTGLQTELLSRVDINLEAARKVDNYLKLTQDYVLTHSGEIDENSSPTPIKNQNDADSSNIAATNDSISTSSSSKSNSQEDE